MAEKYKPARCIRSYNRIFANEFHDCEYCHVPIMPGEGYHAEVWVQGKRLWVKKFHDFCPEDPHDEEERIKREEDEREKPEPESEELDEAA